MISNKVLLLVLLAYLSLSSGCSRRMIFVTHTSLGLNVSGTAQIPNKVALDYSRYEASIVPRMKNGEAQPVFGGLDADINFWEGKHIIREAFATGDAADIAAHSTQHDAPKVENAKGRSNECNTKLHGKPGKPGRSLFFMTGTIYGLHINLGEQATPPNLVVGYQRHTATIIPVQSSAQRVGSVYADLSIATTEPTPAKDSSASESNTPRPTFSRLEGTRIRQFFATGEAAKTLAQETSVQQDLRSLSGTGVTKQFLEELDTQDKLITRIRKIYTKSTNNQVKICEKAKELGLADQVPNDLCTLLKDLDRHVNGNKADTVLLKKLHEFSLNPE